ncbi:hypothetical protein ACS0TY_029900 [Phlomoides rotata]
MNTHFVVSKGNLIHKCVENLIVPESDRFGHNVLSNLVVQNIVSDPIIGVKEIVKLMKNEYGVDITYWKARRSIGGATDQTFGNYNESYDQLRWYSEVIHRTNPGSIVELDVQNEIKHFEIIFIAFNACIQGFKSYRPMLFIDGTFMKGRAKGILLSATEKDGDNGYFLIFTLLLFDFFLVFS